ncbi:MAG: hypothetical protein GF350_11315, partial [Chitinivibrionales bacterium]|nr:hypothetical protein [Chitinivibrionales bacterium]
MLAKFFPWKFFLKRVSKAHGFIDPFALLTRFNRFSQPAEMVAPTELLRAGAVMHARGLLNSQAIQHNLDWVWPYWVCRQFDPESKSFVPRAFAIAHINLTHRNWTATGAPGMKKLPVVDPRGLVTPVFDGWSVDCWICDPDMENCIPAHLETVKQEIRNSHSLQVVTSCSTENHQLNLRAEAHASGGLPVCIIHARGQTGSSRARLIVSLRPYNPEGISLLESIQPLNGVNGWLVNNKYQVQLSDTPEQMRYSTYRQGDVFHRIFSGEGDRMRKAQCDIGMATAAAEFRLEKDREREISVTIPLQHRKETTPVSIDSGSSGERDVWRQSMNTVCRFSVPDEHYGFLYKNALHTMLLHAPDDILAGPYTYNRFWFRDAVLVAHAMLVSGLHGTAQTAINRFPGRQNALGYFVSQEGEWDANGQVLWIYDLTARISGEAPGTKSLRNIIRAADWICRKRISENKDTPHAGLLPAGFSAEHFGPNDYYYWDDFWGIAGLRSAARLLESSDPARARKYAQAARELFEATGRSLAAVARRTDSSVMPVSPNRRPDSAAVGSLAASYPLQLFAPRDSRLYETAEFLFDNCT